MIFWKAGVGIATVASVLILSVPPADARGAETGLASASYGERWVYCSFNLQVDKSADDLIALFERAKRCGYTGVVLADYKFQVLHRVPDWYFRNVERVRAAAARLGIELIPAVFSMGYSNGHLAQDPNLAEGLPVVDQPYLVKNGVAALDSVPAIALKNGGLEEAKGDKFAGFSFQDDPGVTTFADSSVYHQGRVACRLEPGAGVPGRTSPNVRLAQIVELRPHTGYRLSCWVKTRDLAPAGSFQMLALGTGPKGRQLTFHEGGLEPSQDWKYIEVVFNSLDQDEANLYVGFWGEGKGTFWVDDLALEELALVNVLRRPGCPLSVKSADNTTSFEEGRDFEPVADPKLGRVPYEGEFEFNHAGATIRLTRGSRIKDGDRLRVS